MSLIDGGADGGGGDTQIVGGQRAVENASYL